MTLDLSSLTEALAEHDREDSVAIIRDLYQADDLTTLLAAARAILSAPTWNICTTHSDVWATVGACRNGLADNDHLRCNKQPALILYTDTT